MKLTSKLPTLPVIALCALPLIPAIGFAANAPRTHDERGTIKSVDAPSHTLVVTDFKNHSEHKFLWNDQTQFSERGKTATAADLKEGERVRVSYTPTTGSDAPPMQRVRIAPAKTEKASSDKT